LLFACDRASHSIHAARSAVPPIVFSVLFVNFVLRSS
jgi:hypothetical protein